MGNQFKKPSKQPKVLPYQSLLYVQKLENLNIKENNIIVMFTYVKYNK